MIVEKAEATFRALAQLQLQHSEDGDWIKFPGGSLNMPDIVGANLWNFMAQLKNASPEPEDTEKASGRTESEEELIRAFQDAHTTVKVLARLIGELSVTPDSALGIALSVAVDKSERVFHPLEQRLGIAKGAGHE